MKTLYHISYLGNTHRTCANRIPLHSSTVLFEECKISCTQAQSRGGEQTGHSFVGTINLHVSRTALLNRYEHTRHVCDEVYDPSTSSRQFCFRKEGAHQEAKHGCGDGREKKKYEYDDRITVLYYQTILKGREIR